MPAPSDPTTSGTRLRARPAAFPSRDELQRIRFELADKYSGGDFASALALAEELQAKSPNDLSASSFARECRKVLEDESLIRLGSLESVPVLAISMPELRKRTLDHRAGFLVSRVDGETSLETLLDVVAMPRKDALELLVELVEQGILRIEDDR